MKRQQLPAASSHLRACSVHPCRAGASSVLPLEVGVLVKHVRDGGRSPCQGVAGLLVTPRAQSWCLVGGLPVYPEAVDAGVLGVAPVCQDA